MWMTYFPSLKLPTNSHSPKQVNKLLCTDSVRSRKRTPQKVAKSYFRRPKPLRWSKILFLFTFPPENIAMNHCHQYLDSFLVDIILESQFMFKVVIKTPEKRPCFVVNIVDVAKMFPWIENKWSIQRLIQVLIKNLRWIFLWKWLPVYRWMIWSWIRLWSYCLHLCSTKLPKVSNKHNRLMREMYTTSISFLCFYCWLWAHIDLPQNGFISSFEFGWILINWSNGQSN